VYSENPHTLLSQFSFLCVLLTWMYKKSMLSQRWPRDAPYSLYGCSGKFWESLATPTANFPDILMDFCSDRSHDCVQNLKSEGVGLIVRAINFQDLQPMWTWSTNVTDGRSDGQTHTCTDDMRLQDRALQYSASRAKTETKCRHRIAANVCLKYRYIID